MVIAWGVERELFLPTVTTRWWIYHVLNLNRLDLAKSILQTLRPSKFNAAFDTNQGKIYIWLGHDRETTYIHIHHATCKTCFSCVFFMFSFAVVPPLLDLSLEETTEGWQGGLNSCGKGWEGLVQHSATQHLPSLFEWCFLRSVPIHCDVTCRGTLFGVADWCSCNCRAKLEKAAKEQLWQSAVALRRVKAVGRGSPSLVTCALCKRFILQIFQLFRVMWISVSLLLWKTKLGHTVTSFR